MRDRKRRHEPTQGWNTQRDLMEAELYNRAIELQELNESLREAHAREREVGLALQQAMLPAPGSEQYPYAAVRYLPAVGTLNVCGDWYEIVGLGGGRYAVAVGDVVGQGLSAAGVMGQLRSALSAAIRAVESPARALEILGLYAGSVEGALTATAVQAVIDRDAASIVYSRAGHLPPMLVHMDGLVEVLDEVTDPPLGTLPADAVMSEAVTSYAEGDTLVLYTDGLIERRGEDIDVGLGRLVDSLTRHCCRGPEPMADALLRDLEASGGTGDDTALIVVRLPPTDGGRPSAGGRG
jgi:serine phosphatase RsbU (regulator of sigma subunit)